MGLGLQIRCYVNGQQQFIELYGNDRINLDVSFAEVQDITRKNSAYSQEFRVPGSKRNNLIFDYFFDINAVALDFNPKLKFEADILYNGFEIYNGYIRLNSVTINKLEKVYSVTFYTQVGDLASNIGDKGLCEIDTSSLNHDLYETPFLTEDPSLHNPDIIKATNPVYAAFLDTNTPEWDNSVKYGDVQYTLVERGYDYTGSTTGTIVDINTQGTPILSYSGVNGFFDFFKSPVPYTYLMPNIRIKKMYELICSQAGYNIESNFFETDYFKRYYLPLSFNTEQPYMAQAQKFEFSFENLGGEPATTEYLVDDNGTTSYYQIVKPIQILTSNLGFNPVDPTAFGGFGQYLIQVPYGPVKSYDIQVDTEYTGSTPGPGSLILIGDLRLFRFDTIIGSTVFGESIDATSFDFLDDGQDYTNQILGNIVAPDINFNNYYFIGYTGTFPFQVAVPRAYMSITSTQVNLPKTIELYREMSCERKQIEFIQDINRMFNLIAVEHPYKPNTIIVEPVINYIGRGEQLDWTDKVDYDSPQQLYPTTVLINGSIYAANTRDKDFINTQYNTRTNQTFGEQIIDLGVEYKNETMNLTQKLGQNTDYYLNASGNTYPALSCYFITKEVNANGISAFEYRPFRSLPRVAFLGAPIPSGNTGQPTIFFRNQGTNTPFTNVGLNASADIQNVNRLTTYPFALTGFSHYTIYNPSNTYTSDELIYPDLESQYDRYYYDYIQDLISEENKLYKCKMYLTPWEVAQLEFNETIFIRNAKFRLNKISNLNLLEPDTCDVELVKLTREYTPTPLLFYDLVGCNNLCDVIHTHTDLMFPIFAYEGKYIDVTINWSNTGVPTIRRYKVVRTQYNPNYTYESAWITNGYYTAGTIPNDYNVYSNARIYNSCTASTQVSQYTIIDETASGYTANDCYSFDVTNTGGTTTTVTYLNCNYTQASTPINAGVTATFCAIPGSIIGNNITICYDSLTPC